MRTTFARLTVATSFVALLTLAARSRAGVVLNPSDLIVSWAGYPASYVQEYTPTGSLVASWEITSTFSSEYARDIGVNSAGNIVIYNGTFSPSLTILNPSTGDKTNYSFGGWNTAGSVIFGALAVAGNYAYATDDEVNGDGPNQDGVVRFNTTNGSAQRFLAGTGTTSIGMGLNNKLYVISPDSSPGQNVLTIMDSSSMNVEKTVGLPISLSGVTADAAGNIYGTSGTTIYKLDENGNILGSLNTNYALDNIKISPTDQLIMDNNGGQIVESNTTLSTYSEFSLNEPNAQLYASYADFATPLSSPVPEPASALIFGTVMTGLIFYRPRLCSGRGSRG